MAERGRGRRGKGRGPRRGRSVSRDDDYEKTIGMTRDLSISGESSASTSSPLGTPVETTRPAALQETQQFAEPEPTGLEFLPEPELPAQPGASATPKAHGKQVLERYTISGTSTTAPHIEGTDLYPPPRPTNGYCTRGRPIRLKINFFPINLPNSNIHMYHVDVFDDKMKSEDKSVRQKYVCNSVMENLIRTFREDFKGEMPVYDRQASLFTKKSLWGGSSTKEYTVNWLDGENGDKKRTHRVVIAHASEVNLSMVQEFINRKKPYRTALDRQDDFDKGRTAIQAFEVILRQLPQSRHVNIMRSFYFKPHDEPHNLGEGCDIWEGYFQSIRPGQWKPFLNVNTSVSAMMKDMNLIDFICDATRANNAREAMRKKYDLQKLLCNLKISTRHQGFKCVYKINNSSRKVFGKSPSTMTFKVGEGMDTTAEKYFAQKYKIKLQYPDLPCVNVGNKCTTAIPLELCWIVQGQHKSGKLTGDQTANIIKFSAKPAFEREKIIERIAREELITNDPLLNHYGIKPSNKMIEVEGRVLETPTIVYGNKDIVPRDGSWNLMNVTFTGGKQLDRWVIVDFVGVRPDNLDNFIREMQMVGGNSGMRIQDPMAVSSPRVDSRDDEYRIKDRVRAELVNISKKHSGLQMIVVFINGKPIPLENTVMYGHIKSVCDSELGINSQCVRDKNLFKINKSTIANICLKMNAKLGGVNHIVDMARSPSADLFKRPIMFIGADVNHPGVGADEYTPSIAAMVGSLDSKLAKYSSCVRFQKHYRSVVHSRNGQNFKRKDRLEMIDKFEDMFYEQVTTFQKFCKGHLPERIIYYRDGVSEGQFTQVLQWELKAMRRACVRLQEEKPGYEPAITIICVQKRHHLRMFCDRKDQVGRGGNVPPGTCVDKEVTHHLEFDFYLCSHFGLQGTSRPTHYHVLWDENNFTADSLQALTYQLCHTYARATKAVSIPAPVYYSHWVAKRAAMSATFKEDDSSSVSSGSSGDLDKWDEMRKPMLIEKGLMYWA